MVVATNRSSATECISSVLPGAAPGASYCRACSSLSWACRDRQVQTSNVLLQTLNAAHQPASNAACVAQRQLLQLRYAASSRLEPGIALAWREQQECAKYQALMCGRASHLLESSSYLLNKGCPSLPIGGHCPLSLQLVVQVVQDKKQCSRSAHMCRGHSTVAHQLRPPANDGIHSPTMHEQGMQLLLRSQLCQCTGCMRLGQAALLGTLLPAALPLHQQADASEHAGGRLADCSLKELS